MVTKDETALTRVGRGIRGLLAYLIDLLVIYLALSLVFGLFGGKFFLDYTIVRGVCFSCIEPLLGISIFFDIIQLVVLFLTHFGAVVVVLIFFSLYAFVCKHLLEKTLGERLMCIRFESFERDDHQPLESWFLRGSWIAVMIVIPFGFKAILLPITVIMLLIVYVFEIDWFHRSWAFFLGR